MLYHHIVTLVFGMYQYVSVPPAFGSAPPPTTAWYPFSPFTTHDIGGERCTSARIPRCRFTDAYFIHDQNRTVHDTWFRVHAALSAPFRQFESTATACRARATQLGAVTYRYRIATRWCELHDHWELDEAAHPRFQFVYDYTHALTVLERTDVVRRAVVANDCLLDTFDCDDP